MDFAHMGEMAGHLAEVVSHLGGHGAHVGGGAAGVGHDTISHALEKIGKHLEKKANEKIGRQQVGWEKLADSTEEEKVRKGYPANAPLLATGKLRKSIGHTVEGRTVTIGSTDEVMVFHEYGTHKLPPRPVFESLAAENAEFIHRTAQKALAEAMSKGKR
jgi:phage gpG-like protein